MEKKKPKGKTQEQQEIDKKLIFTLDESIPTSQNERKKYMSDIALFSSIFRPKIGHFIGLQLLELAQIGRTEIGDNIIRSNINCFRLIDEWLEKRSNEHFGNLEQTRQSFDEGKELIDELKKKY